MVARRKCLLAQIRAHQKLGTTVMFLDVDSELKQRIDVIIEELGDGIFQAMTSDEHLSEMAVALRSILWIGPVACSPRIVRKPEIGAITGQEAGTLNELAPVAHDSGTLGWKSAIAGGRRTLRHVMFQAASVAAHHNSNRQTFADHIRKSGKPQKVIITVEARKPVTIANAPCKSRLKWLITTP